MLHSHWFWYSQAAVSEVLHSEVLHITLACVDADGLLRCLPLREVKCILHVLPTTGKRCVQVTTPDDISVAERLLSKRQPVAVAFAA